MGERKNALTRVVLLKKDEDVIAYCPECRESLFTGNDRTRTGLRAIKDIISEHNSLQESHEVDVIHPRRKSEQIIDGAVYIDNHAKLSILAEVIHQTNLGKGITSSRIRGVGRS